MYLFSTISNIVSDDGKTPVEKHRPLVPARKRNKKGLWMRSEKAAGVSPPRSFVSLRLRRTAWRAAAALACKPPETACCKTLQRRRNPSPAPLALRCAALPAPLPNEGGRQNKIFVNQLPRLPTVKTWHQRRKRRRRGMSAPAARLVAASA